MELLRDRSRRVVDLQAQADPLFLELNGGRRRRHRMLRGTGHRFQPRKHEWHVRGGLWFDRLDSNGHGPVSRPLFTASPSLGR